MKKSVNCNYKLLDCGEFEKLEQIDGVTLCRPAPQAVWKRKLTAEIWNEYDARYDQDSGEWQTAKELKLPHYKLNDIALELRFSANGQIGVFTEQMQNWLWLEDIVKNSIQELKILNGFAYTGAASLAASFSNSVVTHVDAASSSVNWAKINAGISSKENNKIRWIVDDIRTFMKREQNRENRYDGIILDPPAFGRSKKGGIWKIEKDFPKLVNLAQKLLSSDPEFVILSCHDRNFGKSELIILLKTLIDHKLGEIEILDLVIRSEKGNDLPAGKCARWRKKIL